MTLIDAPIPSNLPTGPAWDVARLFPNQGHWHPEDYLVLNRLTNRMAELSGGFIEVLGMPTGTHQTIVFELCRALKDFIAPRGLGRALVAPYPVRLNATTFREPDVLLIGAAHAEWYTDDFANGADLVMEVLSGDRNRDLVKKRAEYAQAGISEYWIVDPRDEQITVLQLQGNQYVERGTYGAGTRAESLLVPGFGIDVSPLFAAARG